MYQYIVDLLTYDNVPRIAIEVVADTLNEGYRSLQESEMKYDCSLSSMLWSLIGRENMYLLIGMLTPECKRVFLSDDLIDMVYEVDGIKHAFYVIDRYYNRRYYLLQEKRSYSNSILDTAYLHKYEDIFYKYMLEYKVQPHEFIKQ